MRNKIKLMLILAMVSVSFGLGSYAVVNSTPKVPIKVPAQAQKTSTTSLNTAPCEPTNSLTIILNPTKYLNKRVKIRAKFDKFSILGLDYKPAFRSSDKYITFLIKRDDVINHTVPLSEMKNFLKKEVAEKYIDLNTGDDIEYCGTVFSDALGDAWIEVDDFKVLSQKSPKDAVKK